MGAPKCFHECPKKKRKKEKIKREKNVFMNFIPMVQESLNFE
jgi:hypothetical protein